MVVQLEADYKDQENVLAMVMKGVLCLTVDLIRAISFLCIIKYMQTSSYGMKGEYRRGLEIKGIAILNLESKNVLIIDDIFDASNTFFQVYQALAKKKSKIFKVTSFGF